MSGTIAGNSTVGLTLVSTPETITGTISVASGNAIYGGASGTWSLDNGGVLHAKAGYGVLLAGAGIITNTGTIIGDYAGVGVRSLGTLINSGSIGVLSSFGTAVELLGGGLSGQPGRRNDHRLHGREFCRRHGAE